MPDHIQLITIDLDDTLWPCKPVIQAAEQALMEWLNSNAPKISQAHSMESLREHRKALMQQQPEMAHDLTRVREESLRQLGQQCGYPDELMRQASHYFRQWRNRVSPFDDVILALNLLAERYTLVSVTNGNAQVECTPLAGLFHGNLTAAEVGAAKPDPALFHAAAEQTGIALGNALHIGDDPLRDIQAARDAGMYTLWVNRYQSDWPQNIEPADMNLLSLDELITPEISS
ncbi:MAG: HAD family hydrolase [gamma proteobacterium symbiont of Bathyaustriella thionipta]|nr:HAD family hydrolase [gamma proteobacterium symbiont of Bathyaustriella thionipta]